MVRGYGKGHFKNDDQRKAVMSQIYPRITRQTTIYQYKIKSYKPKPKIIQYKQLKEWQKDDFGNYVIYHNPKNPDIKIHFAKIRAHESYGHKYGVWKSGTPCASFIGGSNNLEDAKEIALKEISTRKQEIENRKQEIIELHNKEREGRRYGIYKEKADAQKKREEKLNKKCNELRKDFGIIAIPGVMYNDVLFKPIK